MQFYQHKFRLALFCICSLLLVSCAEKPAFYHDKKYRATTETQRDVDVESCLVEAKENLKGTKAKRITKSGLTSGVATIFSFAALGFAAGNTAHALGAGAVAGMVIATIVGSMSAYSVPDKLLQDYAKECLVDKGYRVVGWQ